MTTLVHHVDTPVRGRGAQTRESVARPDVAANRARLRDLAAQGRSGVNLGDLSPEEINARLLGR